MQSAGNTLLTLNTTTLREAVMSARIYRITNRLTGDFYIGQTYQEIARRWSNHQADVRRGSSTHFHRAIRKYGAENFSVELVEETDAPNEREQHWIAELKPHYNMDEGGKNGLRSPETRRKISESQIGRKLSAATKRLISEKAKLRTGTKNPFYGKNHSEETRRKIAEAQRQRLSMRN